jgi:hypothetical protein
MVCVPDRDGAVLNDKVPWLLAAKRATRTPSAWIW